MKDAVVIAYNKTNNKILGAHKDCQSWGVRYNRIEEQYDHYIQANDGIYFYPPCNLLHLNTPEAKVGGKNWWEAHDRFPNLKEDLKNFGVEIK